MSFANVDDQSQPSWNSMEMTLDEIKFVMLDNYERNGDLDVATWVSRKPEYREEIIDFWLWMKDASFASEIDGEQLPSAHVRVAEDALRNACLAVNFGPQWLEASVQSEADDVVELGKKLEPIRTNIRAPSGKAPIAFRKAAITSWVVSVLQKHRSPVTRLAVQKTTYVLEASMNLGVFSDHDRKPLGPYDYKARYKDAEPIALKKGWLTISGSELHAPKDAIEACRYAARYLRSQDIAERLIVYLSHFSDAELETLATVHSIAKASGLVEHSVSADAVRRELALTKEWRAKVRRKNFSLVCLDAALNQLRALRLLPRS
jgi:hypothetical protein